MLFIFNAIIIIGFIVIIVMAVRKIPVLTEIQKKEFSNFKEPIYIRVKKFDHQKYLADLMIFLEKVLRQMKIFSLKIENILSKWIEVLRNKSRNIRGKIRRIKIKEVEKNKLLEEKTEESPIAMLKEPTEEEKKWIEIIAKSPKNVTAYKELGMLYYRQYNLKDAKECFKMAIKLGSKDKKIREILKEIREKKV